MGDIEGAKLDQSANDRRAAPAGGEFKHLDVADGTRLRYGIWQPEAVSKRGTMIVLPGASEFIEKYFEAIKKLLDRGFSVVVLDWRGQGLSNRPLINPQKHHYESFDSLVSDLDSLVGTLRESGLPQPFNLLTHSMGGHVALRYLHDHPGQIKSAIMSAPMVDIYYAGLPFWLVKWLVKRALVDGRGEDYALHQGDYDFAKGGNYKRTLLTHDGDRFLDEHYFIERNPNLAIGGKTWGWMAAAMETIETLDQPGFAEAIKTPIHIVQAGADRLVRNDAQKAFAIRLPNATFDVVEGARHEILKERDEYQDQFWDLFDQYYPFRNKE